MTYSRTSFILGVGKSTAAQIDAFVARRGRSYAGDRYVNPPAGLGQAIINAARTWPQAVNHDLLTAQCVHETGGWQSEYSRIRNNPSGLGAINDDPDQALWFETPEDGLRATVAHLLTYVSGPGPWTAFDPRAAATPPGWMGSVKRLHELEQKWAWSKPEVYNATPENERYGAKIAMLANQLLETANGEPDVPDTIRIALSSGHHNDDKGGTSGEYERTGVLTAEIARQMRGVDGFDVRVIQPDDGRGDFPGDLYDAASQVGAWAAEGWQADLFLEVHFEGNGAGDAGRGSFAIYPDWGGDVDVDVRDTLGPSMAMQMQALTGIPPRGNGTMSEKNTGVGSQGHRLGVFRATESFTDITRLIYEYGSLTSQADRALINHPDFMQNAARATTLAVAAFYGVDVDRGPEQGGDDVLVIDNNPFGPVKLQRGFRDHFLEIGAAVYPDDPIVGGLAVFGYPVGDEYATGYGSFQPFERYGMSWYRDNQPPFDIIGTLRGEPLPERAA